MVGDGLLEQEADFLGVGDSGAYLDDCQASDPADFAKDMGNAKKLWELSEKLVGDKFDI